MYIDSHCHIERETYGDGLEAVLERARAAGLSHLIVVGATRVAEGAREALALAERLPWVFATAGIHPHDAGRATEDDLGFVEHAMAHPKVVSFGEIGLDYYYDHAPREVQRQVFARQLRAAVAVDEPAMLHVRDAHEDTWRVLDEVGLPARGGVVHCFTGGPREAAEYLARGMLLSIPGVVTFRNAEALREVVRTMPLDRMLIETDSPYLAPVPHRGQRNEPAFVVATAAKIAEVRGTNGEEIGRVTRDNAIRFFRLPAEPASG